MTDDIVEKILNKYKNYPANHYIKLYIKQVDTPRATVTASFEESLFKRQQLNLGWSDVTHAPGLA